MANTRFFKQSFGGGEVTPELYGRIDDIKFQTGAALLRNFVVKPQGPAENRAGLRMVRATKTLGQKARLIPFTFSSDQTVVLEFGAGYVRFHTQGGTILSGAAPYEITTPYTEDVLQDLHFVQSADVLTVVHPNYPPAEFRRLGGTSWTYSIVSLTPTILSPSSFSALCTGFTNPPKYSYSYGVTSVDADGNESSALAGVTVGGNLFETGCTTALSWVAASGAARYRVYKMQGGVYGYIGQTDGLSLIDDNISPDLSLTPPRYETPFGSSGNYPGAVAYFEQRRCFAGTIVDPQTFWATRSGTESAMAYSLPSKDDDRLKFRIAAREMNTIRHIVPLGQLLLLTSSAEWKISSSGDALTPSTINARPQSYVGASNVQPAIINNSILYCAARGGHVREMGFDWQASGYVTGDMSLRAPHLFDGFEIRDMAYGKAPIPVVWFVSSSGKLLSLTYVPEQQIGAWAQHDTDGVFESCCVVAEGAEDVLYVVVARTIGGTVTRFVERMESRHAIAQEDQFFVDCGLTYRGSATSTLTGLGHLEGTTVSILADGAVHAQRVVTGGSVTLDQPATVVHVGLPYVCDLQTLPLSQQIDGGFGQGRPKNVNKAWVRVFRSSGLFVGPSADKLREAKQRTTEPYGVPVGLVSEEMEVMLDPAWGAGGQLYIRQADPLPLTVVSVTAEVAIGG